MALTTVKLTPKIGSEIKADAKTLLSGGAVAKEIRALLEERGVVVVRGLNLTDEEQLKFGESVGTVRKAVVKKKDADGADVQQKETDTGVFKVTFDKKQNPLHADYLYGTFNWHFDGSWEPVPPLASILTPRILSPAGGQTEFANTYAAYDDLPEADKKLFDTLMVNHEQDKNYRNVIANPTAEQERDWMSYPQRQHPLVWRHKSGRKSLVLGSSAARIVGMKDKESEALLERLWAWVTKREYIYQHNWKMGDMLMWDNTGTMHRVLRFDVNCGRRLHRVTLVGEEALAA
jgi:alpha-ketoglutarate-dependent taurine dioxygenase